MSPTQRNFGTPLQYLNGLLYCESILQPGLVEVGSCLCGQAAIDNFMLYNIQYIKEQVSKHDIRGVTHSEQHKMIYLTGIFGIRERFLACNQNAPVQAPQCSSSGRQLNMPVPNC